MPSIFYTICEPKIGILSMMTNQKSSICQTRHYSSPEAVMHWLRSSVMSNSTAETGQNRTRSDDGLGRAESRGRRQRSNSVLRIAWGFSVHAIRYIIAQCVDHIIDVTDPNARM